MWRVDGHLSDPLICLTGNIARALLAEHKERYPDKCIYSLLSFAGETLFGKNTNIGHSDSSGDEDVAIYTSESDDDSDDECVHAYLGNSDDDDSDGDDQETAIGDKSVQENVHADKGEEKVDAKHTCDNEDDDDQHANCPFDCKTLGRGKVWDVVRATSEQTCIELLGNSANHRFYSTPIAFVGGGVIRTAAATFLKQPPPPLFGKFPLATRPHSPGNVGYFIVSQGTGGSAIASILLELL